MNTEQHLFSEKPYRNSNPSFQDFLKRRVSTQSPVPCEYKAGDIVTVTNGYGVEIPGKRILGFLKEIDPDWRPNHFIILDWDCYWTGVSVENLKLEKAAQ